MAKIGRNVSTPENQAWWDRIDHMTRRERDELTELRRDLERVRSAPMAPAVERICAVAERWLRHQERLFGVDRGK